MFIVDVWNSMSLAAQIFAMIAIPATLLLLIQTVMMFMGIGDDADGAGDDIADEVDLSDDLPDEADGVFGDQTDADSADLAGLDGLRILTMRGIIAFLVVFGWVGVALDTAGVSLFVSLPVAFVSGFAMMVLLAFLMRAVMKLRDNGNADNRNAVGVSGKVYLAIPPSRSGVGKVHIMLQGAYVERDAVTDSPEVIPTGCEIVVVGLSGQTDLVVRKK